MMKKYPGKCHYKLAANFMMARQKTFAVWQQAETSFWGEKMTPGELQSDISNQQDATLEIVVNEKQLREGIIPRK